MKDTKFERIYRDLTSVAQKVYDAVPINECWSTAQICGELRRRGIHKDHSLVAGCLNSLIRDGLVVERPPRDLFTRTAVRISTVATPEPPEDIPVVTPPAAKVSRPLSPMERIAMLSERARVLSKDLALLADDMDTAALTIDKEIESMGADMAKLRQFQQLLKGLAS